MPTKRLIVGETIVHACCNETHEKERNDVATNLFWLGRIGDGDQFNTFAKQIKLDVGLAKPTVFVSENGKPENHLRIALTGFELNKTQERMLSTLRL